jgi:hypothetical protein
VVGAWYVLGELRFEAADLATDAFVQANNALYCLLTGCTIAGTLNTVSMTATSNVIAGGTLTATGNVYAGSSGTTVGALHLSCGASAAQDCVFKGSSSSIASMSVSFPPADGTSGQSMTTNGAGVWGWTTVSGSGAFSSLTGGTNASAAMVVGSGASLASSGTGSINATQLGGATFGAPGAIGGTTPAAGAFTTGVFSAAGAASTPGASVTGTPYTGGSATTNFPQLYINAGASPSTFSTAGTELGINAPSGFIGNLLDFRVNGGVLLSSLDYQGNFMAAGLYSGNGSSPPGLITLGGACASAASPAVCGAASAGFVAIPTGTNPTLVVDTTNIATTSKIFLTPDSTLGTALSVTCNSTLATLAGGTAITARTAGTSFTISFNGTVSTNPVCLSYLLVN